MCIYIYMYVCVYSELRLFCVDCVCLRLGRDKFLPVLGAEARYSRTYLFSFTSELPWLTHKHFSTSPCLHDFDFRRSVIHLFVPNTVLFFRILFNSSSHSSIGLSVFYRESMDLDNAQSHKRNTIDSPPVDIICADR